MLLNVRGFFDYCIEEQCVEKNYETTVKLLYDYGYRTIAINQSLNAGESEPKKKKKKGGTAVDCVPEPFEVKPVEGCEDMRILNRLTVVFGSGDVLHKIVKSPNYKKFDIIAVLPTTAPATLFVCSNFDGDIFCFNPENKNHVKKSRKMCRQLIEKGFHFELPYSPAIEDATKRKHIIHSAHMYHMLIKSKNIILSSGATKPSLIKNPYDIVNLALIFGLNEHQAKNSITHNGRQVYISSVGRRHGKAVVFVENIESEIGGVTEKIDDVICLSEEEEDVEEMETNQPPMKKIKQ